MASDQRKTNDAIERRIRELEAELARASARTTPPPRAQPSPPSRAQSQAPQKPEAKPKSRLPLLLGVALIIALGAWLFLLRPAVPQLPKATGLGIGSTVRVTYLGGYDFNSTVTKVERQKTLTRQGSRIDAQGIWLVIHYRVQNLTKQPSTPSFFSESGGDWTGTVTDSAGNSYLSRGIFDANWSSNWGDLAILPGATKDYWQPWDVNPEASGFKLTISGVYGVRETRYVIDLERQG